jgi:hypothetical protein
MGGGRQAWCPRCDEVQEARPGTSCAVCGRELLAVPAWPGQPQPGRGDQLARRLRVLRPAAGAVGAGLLVLAVVAGAFAAGQVTRTTPPTAAATASTGPGPVDDGPAAGNRDFDGWQAQAGGITVSLRSLTVGTGFSRLVLHFHGVPRGREVSAIDRLRIRDAAGQDLLLGGAQTRIATSRNWPGAGGGLDTEVVLDRPVELQAVASVELGDLTLGRIIRDELAGSLHDPELQRLSADNDDDTEWLASRRGCPGCAVEVACQDCTTLRVVSYTYRRGRVLIAVEALDRVEETTLNPSRRRVLVNGTGGFSELPAWIDGSGKTAVISIAADVMAVSRFGDGDEPMPFTVIVRAQAEQVVRGSWALRGAGG